MHFVLLQYHTKMKHYTYEIVSVVKSAYTFLHFQNLNVAVKDKYISTYIVCICYRMIKSSFICFIYFEGIKTFLQENS